MNQIPTKPRPPMRDQERANRQQLRWQILDEDFDQPALDWMGKHVQKERLATWGPPDTSMNLLASLSRQLTTPGLYESPPMVSHKDPRAATLADPDGPFKTSGLWTRQQHVQYMAVGMGEAIVRDDLGPAGISHRLVEPYAIEAWANSDAPDIPVKIRELRSRWHPTTKAWVWAWDDFDLTGDEPAYRVWWVTRGKEVPATNLWVRRNGEPAPAEGLVGAAYDFRDPDRGGEPFLPYTWYRAVDTGRLWNTNHMRGAVIGTLNAVKHQTFAGRAALDATGTAVIGIDLDPALSSVQTTGENAGGPTVHTVQLSPGAIFLMRSREEAKNPSVHQVGPGINLPNLSSFALAYKTDIATSWGLNPSDLMRTSKDPSSGAALAISESGRRRFARRVTPLFERADCDRLRKIAAMLKVAGLYDGPTGKFSIRYTEIEASPAERQAEREDVDWQVSGGYLSPIEGYQRVHPGTSAAAARAAIIDAKVEAATIEHEVKQRLLAAGIEPVEPSPDNASTNQPANPAK